MRICKDCNSIRFSVLEKKILKRLKRVKQASGQELAEHCVVTLPAVHLAVKGLEKANLVKTKKVKAVHGIKKVVWI